MEKTYKAFVTDKETGRKTFIVSEYESSSTFRKDLRANGYSVSRIELAEVYDFVLDNTNCEKWDFEDAREFFKTSQEKTRENFRKFQENKIFNK